MSHLNTRALHVRLPARDAVDRGLAALAAAVDPRLGIQSSLAFRGDFADAFPLAELRARSIARHRIDPGFDAGPETFSAMVAARLLARAGVRGALLSALCRSFADRHLERRFRFFHGGLGFAADADCTGVALAALHDARALRREHLFAGARELLACVPERHAERDDAALVDHVPLVYWDDDREPGVARRGLKQDPVVAANALYALLAAEEAGLADPRLPRFVAATLGYLRDALSSGVERTRYYPSRDALLCFVGELQARFPALQPELALSLRTAVRVRLADREAPETPIDLAMRLLAAAAARLDPAPLRERLLAAQRDDGTWPAGPFFTLGRIPGLAFGSAALTTAFAVAALRSTATEVVR